MRRLSQSERKTQFKLQIEIEEKVPFSLVQNVSYIIFKPALDRASATRGTSVCHQLV